MTQYTVTNPATGQTEAEYPTATDDQVQYALAAADKAFAVLAGLTPDERAALLHRVADLHAERRDELAAIITREVGKPITQSLGEVEIVISIYRYYAENGP